MNMVLNSSVNIMYRWIILKIFPIVYNESTCGHGAGRISNCLYRVVHEVLGCAVAVILTVSCRGMLLTGTYIMFSVSDSLLCVWWSIIFQVTFGICLRCPDFHMSQNVLIVVGPICYVLECPAPCWDTTALSQDVEWDLCTGWPMGTWQLYNKQHSVVFQVNSHLFIYLFIYTKLKLKTCHTRWLSLKNDTSKMTAVFLDAVF